MTIKLRPYQEVALKELRQSDDLLRTFAGWSQDMGKSIVISAYIQELREVNYLMARVLEKLWFTNLTEEMSTRDKNR